jgi:hypothetical protein
VATPAIRTTIQTDGTRRIASPVQGADVATLSAAALETPNRAIPSEHQSAQIPSASVASSIREPKTVFGREALRAPGGSGSKADIAESVYRRHAPAGDVVTVETPPTPADTAQTPYGDIGKWMLRSGNEIANWGGVKYRCKTIYEPINVVVVDPTSTTVQESTQRLNAVMAAAGFPAVALHSTGFAGTVDGITYTQQPAAGGQAFSDAFFLLPNNHGRVFGPAPGPGGTGYVWTASFSRERIGFYHLVPRHVYVSFDRAREAVRDGLVRAGAIDLGLVDLDNEYSSPASTTGDHDGFAEVIVLT